MYLLTKECSALLSDQAKHVSVNLQNQMGLFGVMQYLVLGVAPCGCEVSTKYDIVNHDQVIQWFMSIPSKSTFLQTYHPERKE